MKIAAIISAGVFLLGCNSAAAEDTLRSVISIARHGVRGVYPPPGQNVTNADSFSLYTTTGFQLPIRDVDWNMTTSDGFVQPILTSRGKDLSVKMGQYMRTTYGKLLLKSDGSVDCKAIAGYADLTSGRDVETLKLYLQGMVPECTELYSFDPKKDKYTVAPYTDYASQVLYNNGGNVTAECKLADKWELAGSAGGFDNIANLVSSHKDTIQKLSDTIGCCKPALCGKADGEKCTLLDIPEKYVGLFFRPFEGAIAHAEYLVELLQMSTFSKGQLPTGFTKDDLLALERFRQEEFDLMVNPMINSQTTGSSLVIHLLASMYQTITGRCSKLGGNVFINDKRTRLAIHQAHDIDMGKLARLYDLNWVQPNRALDAASPSGQLTFELHQDASVGWHVVLYYEAPTFDQLLTGTLDAAHPANRVRVTIPRCAKTRDSGAELYCTFRDFAKLSLGTIRDACVDPALRSFQNKLEFLLKASEFLPQNFPFGRK